MGGGFNFLVNEFLGGVWGVRRGYETVCRRRPPRLTRSFLIFGVSYIRDRTRTEYPKNGWLGGSFRTVKEAVEAARDGDRVVMLRGLHNFSGEAVDIKKRILIKSEGDHGPKFLGNHEP